MSKTLPQLQAYFAEKAKERGFDKESPQDILLLLTEELGELAKAIRKTAGIKTDVAANKYDVEEEIADVFNYLLHLSNTLGISLEDAFEKKEAENNKRTWK